MSTLFKAAILTRFPTDLAVLLDDGPGADLAVIKNGSPNPVGVGGNLTYTIGVSNSGPGIATGITVTDILPPGVSFFSGSFQSPGLVEVLDKDVSAQADGINNVFTVANTPLADVDGDGITDAHVTVDGVGFVNAAVNAGTGEITLVVAPPAGSTVLVTYYYSVPSSGTRGYSLGRVTCNLSDLGMGGTATVTIVVTPNVTGTLTNAAEVTAIANEPVMSDNSATVSTTVMQVLATCMGLPATIVGSPVNDIILGTAGPDVIVGLEGDDVIDGFDGNDVICGGPGKDVIDEGPGDDKI